MRVRPGRGSRARTRTRPAHTDAEDGVVVGVDRGRIRCRAGGRDVVAMRARELGRRAVAVGDRVSLVGDTGGEPDALARIVRIAARTTVLRRTADDTDPVERVIVANALQMLIVVAAADPPPRTGLVDRCLIAARAAGIEPLLCLTKTDLTGDVTALRDRYADTGMPLLTTRRDTDPTGLRAALTSSTTVLVGHSGVGKSTLVNRLVPHADRATGAVNAVTGRGRHTSSSAVALSLDPGESTWIIDTPGVRSFGLAHVSAGDVVAPFPVLATAAEQCPPGCDHREGTDGCALDAAAATGGPVATDQLRSVRQLLSGRNSEW